MAKQRCSNCSGRGTVQCSKCDGKGRYEDGFASFGRGVSEFVSFKHIKPRLNKCFICNGKGFHKCTDCYGRGYTN